jgi:hypothetical protein
MIASLCIRLPGGLWLIGPYTRRVISAALDDAAAYRRHHDLDGPDGCTACPTRADIDALALMGVAPPGPCQDHQLDADAERAYLDLLARIGLSAAALDRIRTRLEKEET